MLGSLVNRRWTEVDLASNGQVQPTAFEAGYQTIMGDDEIFFLAHGGVTVEYMPGLSTNMRIGSRVRNLCRCLLCSFSIPAHDCTLSWAGAQPVPALPAESADQRLPGTCAGIMGGWDQHDQVLHPASCREGRVPAQGLVGDGCWWWQMDAHPPKIAEAGVHLRTATVQQRFRSHNRPVLELCAHTTAVVDAGTACRDPMPACVSLFCKKLRHCVRQVKERVSPCTWIKTQYLPPANDAACARQIDPETRSCVLPLPPAMTCEPPPRFMHTVTAGKLMGGKDAAVVYGGVSSTGELLSDMWMYPLYDTFPTTMACENCGWVVRAVVFAKIANLVCDQRSIVQFKRLVSTMTTGSDSNSAMVHYDIIRSPSTSLNPAQPICQYSCTNERWVFSTYSDSNPSAAAASTTREASEVLLTLKISITNPKNYYDMQVKCASVGGCKELYAEAVQALYKDTECTNPANPNVNNCPLAGSALLRFETVAGEELSRCYRRVIGRTPPSPAGAQTFFFSEFQKTCLLYREARVDAFDLDSQIDCTENCVRGYCQFQDIARYEDQYVPCTCWVQ